MPAAKTKTVPAEPTATLVLSWLICVFVCHVYDCFGVAVDVVVAIVVAVDVVVAVAVVIVTSDAHIHACRCCIRCLQIDLGSEIESGI